MNNLPQYVVEPEFRPGSLSPESRLLNTTCTLLCLINGEDEFHFGDEPEAPSGHLNGETQWFGVSKRNSIT